MSSVCARLTEDGEHHAVLEDLHGAGADKEESLERVAMPQQVLAGCAERRLDVQRE